MRRWLAVGVVSIAVVVGCNAILGIDPPEPVAAEAGTPLDGAPDASPADGGDASSLDGLAEGSPLAPPCPDSPPTCSPELVVSSQSGPSTVLVKGGRIYWTNDRRSTFPGGVFSAALDGGDQVQYGSQVDQPKRVIVAGDRVYWTVTPFDRSEDAGTVYSASLDGGDVSAVFEKVNFPIGLAAHDSTVVVGDIDGFWALSADGGHRPLTSVRGPKSKLLIEGSDLYAAVSSIFLGVYRVPLDGGDASVIDSFHTMTDDYSSCALAGGAIYFDRDFAAGDASVQGIQKCSALGCGGSNAPFYTVDGATLPADGVVDIVTDDRFVYFTVGTGKVLRIALSGGNATELSAADGGGVGVEGIAVDGPFVYWTNYPAGQIWKVDRCCVP